jgi:23S rRNA pseudouridine2605 synthase
MGMIVDPYKQDVRFDDEKIRMERPVYYLVYKPKDVLCTTADGWGRKTIIDMLGDRVHARLFSVGRLELESEGLVLLTNDGDFAQRCLHPRRGLDRTYYVKVRGSVSRETIDKARAGVWLSGRQDRSDGSPGSADRPRRFDVPLHAGRTPTSRIAPALGASRSPRRTYGARRHRFGRNVRN